jgi:hypothetical protein
MLIISGAQHDASASHQEPLIDIACFGVFACMMVGGGWILLGYFIIYYQPADSQSNAPTAHNSQQERGSIRSNNKEEGCCW